MKTNRYTVLDTIRGLNLISMIAYHTVWDMVYMFGVKLLWYKGMAGYIWQQSICWCFILLSGFCWSFSRNKWKHGVTVFLAGVLVSIVTLIAMPENIVIFGVLTLLGTCMLLMIPLDKVLWKWNPLAGLVISVALFVMTRNINDGMLGFEKWRLVRLPSAWYRNLVTTFVGFTARDFHSADYFSLLPWIFLFLAGYFLHAVCRKRGWLKYLWGSRAENGLSAEGEFHAEGNLNSIEAGSRKNGQRRGLLKTLGRHSLLIYLLHQPIIYVILSVCYGGIL